MKVAVFLFVFVVWFCSSTQSFHLPSQRWVSSRKDYRSCTTRRHYRDSATATATASASAGTAVRLLSSAVSRAATALGGLTPLQRALFAAAFVLGFLCGKIEPPWSRYRDVNDIPTKRFGAGATALTGRVVRISDGDTFRFYHTPLFWQTPPAKMKVSEQALPIRLCTIDTPETAKFGKPGQPFGREAKEELRAFLGGAVVRVRLLRKDQYGRAVAQVFKGRRPFRTHVDSHMLRKGLAEVYEGGGAVYGPQGKEAYLTLANTARKEKRGIWSDENRETAAEFKKRNK